MQLFSMLSFFLSVRVCVITSESSSAPPRRVIRATDDPLSSAIDKMQKLSRLITAIHIRAGINTGSLTSDDIVPELLRLGSVTPSQIINMDSAKLASAMKAIEELPGKLNKDPASSNAEEKLKLMHDVRQMAKNVGNVKKWDGKRAFVVEMRKIGSNGVDMKLLLDIYRSTRFWKEDLSKIEKLIPSDDNFVTSAQVFIRELQKSSNGLLSGLDALIASGDLKPWNKYPTVKSAEDALSYVYHLSDIMKTAVTNEPKLSSVPADFINFDTYLGTDLNQLSATVKTISDVSSDLKVVQAVSMSRGSDFTKPTNFPGLPDGFDDIDQVFSDLSDVWLAKVVDVGKLNSALALLKSLIPAFKSTDKALGATGDLDYFEVVDGILKVPSETTDMKTTMDGYLACSRNFRPSGVPNVTVLDPLFDLATKLDNKVNSIDSQVPKLLQLLDTDETREMLKTTANLAVVPSDNSQLGAKLDSLKNSKVVADLSDIIDQAMNIYFSAIDHDIKAVANGLITQANLVKAFQKTLDEYPALFTCLRDISDWKVQMVADAVSMVEKFRGGINQKVLTDGEALVNKFSTTYKDHFKNLTEAIESMQNQSSLEVNRLNLLISPEMYSKDISLATIGVTKMKKALDHQKDAEVITGGLRVINEQFDALGDTINESDEKNLRNLMYLKWPLDQMYRQLREWRSAVRATDSTDLEDYYHLFYFALSVEGITDKLEPMSESVDRLSKKVTNQTIKDHLITVSGALNNLSTLDLNFAAYHQNFTNVRDTLSVLDMFFNNYKNSFAVYPKAPIVPWGPPESAITTITTTITTIKPYQPMGYTGGSSFGTLFTFLGVVFTVLGAMTGFVIWLKVTAPKK